MNLIDYCKKLRYVGENNEFDNPIILDVNFDDIFWLLHGIENIIGYNKDGVPVGKPRFNCLCPSSHCEYPIISKDYYLVGFTNELNRHCKKFRFANGAGNEYLDIKNLNNIEYVDREFDNLSTNTN